MNTLRRMTMALWVAQVKYISQIIVIKFKFGSSNFDRLNRAKWSTNRESKQLVAKLCLQLMHHLQTITSKKPISTTYFLLSFH